MMNMFDLENDLPDELMTSSSWAISTSDTNDTHNVEIPATGPGPGGSLQNSQDTPNNIHRHVNHLIPQVCVWIFINLFGTHFFYLVNF